MAGLTRWTVRILQVQDTTLCGKPAVSIRYYDQAAEGPHINYLESFVHPDIRKQLVVGMVFANYQEFFDFVNQGGK